MFTKIRQYINDSGIFDPPTEKQIDNLLNM